MIFHSAHSIMAMALKTKRWAFVVLALSASTALARAT